MMGLYCPPPTKSRIRNSSTRNLRSHGALDELEHALDEISRAGEDRHDQNSQQSESTARDRLKNRTQSRPSVQRTTQEPSSAPTRRVLQAANGSPGDSSAPLTPPPSYSDSCSTDLPYVSTSPENEEDEWDRLKKQQLKAFEGFQVKAPQPEKKWFTVKMAKIKSWWEKHWPKFAFGLQVSAVVMLIVCVCMI